MKAPANFTASATKKINPLEAAINSNFSQNSSQNTPSEARETVLTNENANPSENPPSPANSAAISSEKSQILNGRTSETVVSTPLNDQTKTPARREVKEKFLVSMSKGERSVFKAFCAMQNVSMNHFVMCAMDYFKEDLENGKVSLSAHSYKRKES